MGAEITKEAESIISPSSSALPISVEHQPHHSPTSLIPSKHPSYTHNLPSPLIFYFQNRPKPLGASQESHRTTAHDKQRYVPVLVQVGLHVPPTISPPQVHTCSISALPCGEEFSPCLSAVSGPSPHQLSRITITGKYISKPPPRS